MKGDSGYVKNDLLNVAAAGVLPALDTGQNMAGESTSPVTGCHVPHWSGASGHRLIAAVATKDTALGWVVPICTAPCTRTEQVRELGWPPAEH